MADIFLKIVNMSISAGWIILAVLLLRLVLKKAPRWIYCVLWGIAGLRLVMPFSFESIFSLVPSAEAITKAPDAPRPQLSSGVSVIDNQVNAYLQGNYFEGVTRPAGNFADISTILSIVWLVGIAALLIYAVVSFSRLKRKVSTAVRLSESIYQSEAVSSPFVLGIIKPKIYLPFNMSSQNTELVIAHETAHIRRRDHLWKPLGFLILTLHWFNPVVWLGYILLCRDIELACDEKVVKELDYNQRADYSEALLNCSINRRIITACPLAFGEIGVKNRVKNVLNYKKPAFWIVAVAVIASITVAVCFLTNPKTVMLTAVQGYYETELVIYSENELENSYKNVYFITDEYELKRLSDNSIVPLGKLQKSNADIDYIRQFIKNDTVLLSDYGIEKITEAAAAIPADAASDEEYLVMKTSSGKILLAVFEKDEETENGVIRLHSLERLKFYDEDSEKETSPASEETTEHISTNQPQENSSSTPSENATDLSGVSYLHRCDDANINEALGNGTIQLPELPAGISLQECALVLCDDGCDAKELTQRLTQGFARTYNMESDGELNGNHRILKFKMTVPEQMADTLKQQGIYEDVLAEHTSNYYYLIPLDETHYGYIHLEGENEEDADSIAKRTQIAINLLTEEPS